MVCLKAGLYLDLLRAGPLGIGDMSIPEDLHRLSQGAAARSPAAALGSSSSRSAGIPQTCTLLLAEQKYNKQPQNNYNNQLGTQEK